MVYIYSFENFGTRSCIPGPPFFCSLFLSNEFLWAQVLGGVISLENMLSPRMKIRTDTDHYKRAVTVNKTFLERYFGIKPILQLQIQLRLIIVDPQAE